MLKSLYVKNFALLDKIEVAFGPGLNIITGETGAGKSILIDALGSTLGEKIDVEALRTGSDKAVVEGIFTIDNLKEIKNNLEKYQIEKLNDTIILRSRSPSGCATIGTESSGSVNPPTPAGSS